MEIANREIVTTSAASLVMGKLPRVISGKLASNATRATALVPVFGIRWSAAVIRRILGRRLCGILGLLRNSKLPQANYNRVAQLWKDDWEAWRPALGRFDLYDAALAQEWIPPAKWRLGQDFTGPCALAKSPSPMPKCLISGEKPPP